MRSAVVFVAFSTTSVLACGSDTPTGSGTPTVASVVVTPSTAALESLGATVQLTASARDASGNTISGKTFTWSSSDANIATVSSSGLATAIGNGVATITATTEGVQGSSSLTVAQVVSRVVSYVSYSSWPNGTSTPSGSRSGSRKIQHPNASNP